MNSVVTEEDYPIQGRWILKSMIFYFISAIFMLIFVYYSLGPEEFSVGLYVNITIYLIVGIFFGAIIPYWRKSCFHYALEDKFLTLKQGIISKQERHIPYGVIQNLFIKQDVIDRVLNLASLAIENAVQTTRTPGAEEKQSEQIGFSGNRVAIPGLTKHNAEVLKEAVLQKMKENPIEDSQSGL